MPPKTTIGKALVYLNNQWIRLVGYIDDGAYPIDNNAAERAIRPFVIGRKIWMLNKSLVGAKASANTYNLIETAKANAVNVYDYLQYVFKKLPNIKSVVDIDALLPWNASMPLYWRLRIMLRVGEIRVAILRQKARHDADDFPYQRLTSVLFYG